MNTSPISFHLRNGEIPEATAHHHTQAGVGYVEFGSIVVHGRFEDLAATLTLALTAVSGLMVDDLLAAMDLPEDEEQDNRCRTCGGNGCENACGLCEHASTAAWGPDAHKVCHSCGGSGTADAEVLAS